MDNTKLRTKEPFDGNFHPDMIGQDLKEKYDFKCPECGNQMWLKPSIFMSMGCNSGAASCVKCKTHLMLEVNDTNDGANAQVFQPNPRKENEDDAE